jgi:hypothetical protein
MAFYEVIGSDSRRKSVSVGNGEKASVALGQLRAARRSLPVHDLYVQVDGIEISETELMRRAEDEANA